MSSLTTHAVHVSLADPGHGGKSHPGGFTQNFQQCGHRLQFADRGNVPRDLFGGSRCDCGSGGTNLATNQILAAWREDCATDLRAA